jgi:hypothetical protein
MHLDLKKQTKTKKKNPNKQKHNTFLIGRVDNTVRIFVLPLKMADKATPKCDFCRWAL